MAPERLLHPRERLRNRAIFLWVTRVRLTSALGLAGLIVAPTLGGCAVTPVVAFARVALDGASLMATGKSTNGHGLSFLTGDDCEPGRALEGKEICRPNGWPDSDANPSDSMVEPSHSQSGAVFAAMTQDDVLTTAFDRPEFTEPEAPVPYVVVASFRDPDDAKIVALELAGLPATISPASLDGRVYHRVVVGPLDSKLEAVLPERLAKAGILTFFPVLLCPEDQTVPPCISRPRYRPRIDPDKVAAANDPYAQIQKN